MAANITVLRTPKRTANSLDSSVAGVTQLLYELQFWNYQFNAYQSNGGFYEFGVTSPDVGEIIVGMELSFRAIDGSIQVIGEVTAINVNLITIDQPYDGANIFVDGYITRLIQEPTYQALPNYRIVLRLEGLNNTEYVYVPDAYYYFYIDLGRVIEPIIISNALEGDPTAPILWDYSSISYQEVWTGGSQIKQFFDKNLFTLAERQIGSFLGSNLWEMTLKTANLPTYDVGNLLTKFESKQVTRWIGWKRTVACIVDPDIAIRFPVNAIEWYFRDADINMNSIGTLNTFGIAKSPYRLDGRELPADQGGYYTEVFIRDDVTLERISETLFYKNEDECYNPVMLEWLNEDGGPEQYLFTLDQVISDDVEEGLIYERPITQDIENVVRTEFRTVDKWSQRMTLFAKDLTQDQVDALHDIKRSDFVRVWLNKDGSKFKGVIVIPPYANTFRTRNSLHEFTITIKFPNNFDFYNAKEY